MIEDDAMLAKELLWLKMMFVALLLQKLMLR